ncbi:hypothetical protein Bca101_061432 [Brassica carinata]
MSVDMLLHSWMGRLRKPVPLPHGDYRFSNYDHLMALANTNTDLPGLFKYPRRSERIPSHCKVEEIETDNGRSEVLTYRVQLAVSDASDTAVFVSFDTAMAQLSNIRAAEVS